MKYHQLFMLFSMMFLATSFISTEISNRIPCLVLSIMWLIGAVYVGKDE